MAVDTRPDQIVQMWRNGIGQENGVHHTFGHAPEETNHGHQKTDQHTVEHCCRSP